MGDLEALKAIAALGLTSHDIEDLIDELSTFGVVTLGPVVAYRRVIGFALSIGCEILTSTTLTKDEVVGSEQLTERTSADSVHGSRLEIDEDCARDILVASSLVS